MRLRMNNLLDPLKIIICGGPSSGKTSIFNRYVGRSFLQTYSPTSCGNKAVCLVELSSSATLAVTIIDLSGSFLEGVNQNGIFRVLSTADGAVIVVDCANEQSLKDSDCWIDSLNMNCENLEKVLLMNKADLLKCQNNELIVLPSNINSFVRHTGILDWSYTVGSPDLVDIDFSRGNADKQNAPEGLLSKLILTILHKRHRFYKLMKLPLKYSVTSVEEVNLEDIHKLM